MIIIVWLAASVVAGFMAGWVIGAYGHRARAATKATDRKLIAIALSRTNDPGRMYE